MQEPTAPPDPLPNGHDAAERPGKTTRVSDMSLGSDTSHRPSSASTSQRISEDVVAEPEELQDEPAIELPAVSPFKSPSYQSTVIELVSISATSSAFPESFGLSVSSRGRWIVAFSSAALYIIPAQELPLIQNRCRAFRLRRKPLAVVINDVGKYAILTDPYKIDVYQCGDGSVASLTGPNQKIQTIQLNAETRAIAISTTGELIAAGSDAGVEIIGIGLPEGSGRRQIQSGPVESITFSEDQKSLLVTGPARRTRNTTLLTISVGFEQAMLMEEEDEEQQIPVGKLWISQLIFPEQLQARQSVFLPDPGNGQACELLAYDKKVDSFGIFDTVLKTFTGKALGAPEDAIWSGSGRYEDTLLGVSPTGSDIAVAVRLDEVSEIWTYKTSSEWRDEDGPITTNLPLQRLSISAQANATTESINCLRWIQEDNSQPVKLLALISTVARSMPEDMEATAATAASGKIIMFDLDVHENRAELRQEMVSVDLDEYPLTEELAEERVEMDREIDLVRRRTQVQRSQRSREPQRRRESPATPPQRTLRRSISTSSRNSYTGGFQEVDLHSSRLPRRRSFSSISSAGEDNDLGPGVAVDEPYSQSAPRPQFMLNRAATVAQNAPAARTHLRAVPTRPLDYRRADGLREIPHESDADNWVPPPPPYSERPDAPGPNAISLPIHTIPGLAERVLQGSHVQQNQNPSPHGMRARVSQVVSGFQVPAVVPQPRSPVQPRYADSSRPPGPPPNVSIGSGSIRRTPQSAFPVVSSVSRNQSSHVTRRPLSTNILPPSSRFSNNTMTLAGPPLEMASTPVLVPAQPIPGVLNSPLTFPITQRTRVNSNVPLVIPRTSSSRSVSAPVTPINQNQVTSHHNRNSQQSFHVQTPNSASPGPTSNPYSRHSRVSREESLFTPHAPLASSQSRRVASAAELMRPLPPVPDGQVQPARQSSDISFESSSRNTQQRLGQLSTSQLDHHQQRDSPDTPSRRHWWRGGSTPARPLTSAAHTPTMSRQGTSDSDHQEKKEKCLVM